MTKTKMTLDRLAIIINTGLQNMHDHFTGLITNLDNKLSGKIDGLSMEVSDIKLRLDSKADRFELEAIKKKINRTK
jgi:hypothetical protein